MNRGWFLTWIAAAVVFAAGLMRSAPVSAQCNGGCAQAAEQWGFVSASVPIAIGMIQSGSQWVPALCQFNGGAWHIVAAVGPARPARALTAITSICGAATNNHFIRVPETAALSCLTAPQFGGNGGNPHPPVVLRGFSNGVFDFWMSGGDGDDTIKSDDSGAICGGAGNDILIGGSGTQYIVGEAGHDYVDGGAGSDSVRGSHGNDVVRHVNASDVDKVRADADNDCLISEMCPIRPTRRARPAWTDTSRPAASRRRPSVKSPRRNPRVARKAVATAISPRRPGSRFA